MRAVIPTIVVQSLLHDELRLGSLEPIRDFTFVEDTARGFLAAADSEKVIGEVVNLRNTIDWFEKRALFGKRIVVTRTREQASELVAGLVVAGAFLWAIRKREPKEDDV